MSSRPSQPSLFDDTSADPTVTTPAPVGPTFRSGAVAMPETIAENALPNTDTADLKVGPTTGEDEDSRARAFAVDPRHHVVLEASAGTGKTSVLVARYINLLKAGVEPANILAITFTRKAAAEMRERIVRELRDSAARSAFDRDRWLDLRDRLGEIAISTIDAFCLSLLREFPLEADLDPGFEMADETEVPRLIDEALDRTLRILGGVAKQDPDVAMVLAQLGTSRAREGLGLLLDRRLVAWDALDRFLLKGPSDLTAATVCRRAATALQDALRTVPGGLAAFLADGPVHHPRYQRLVAELQRFSDPADGSGPPLDAQLRGLVDRVAGHFLTGEGRARRGGSLHPYGADHYPSAPAAKRHRAAVFQIAPVIEQAVAAFARDLNVVLARGVRRMFAIALAQYRQALDERSVLDFADVLQHALDLLRQMDEFSQSRFRLESRYHHVLVDEFQDTSRAQWELVSLLIQSWKEGMGVAAEPSIFIVGDRKQSIYRFRDAEVAVLQEAARHIESLRGSSVAARRSITRSFRSVPELLAFVNDLFAEMSQAGGPSAELRAGPSTELRTGPSAELRASRPDDFVYGDTDRFPVTAGSDRSRGPVLGIAAADDPLLSAAAVAAEVERILREESVRDRTTGVPRPARPGDIAILFRSRASHRDFERALESRRIPAYVYKGLGFFDADEIKDLSALIRYLANPGSNLRAAAFLRSRFVRLSDRGLAAVAPRCAAALTDPDPAPLDRLDAEDRLVLSHVRAHIPRWLALVDRIPPADVIEQLLPQTAYAYEISGPHSRQAWENIKKMRGLVRRIQNRGYATFVRIADHIDALTPGDESNAVVEALDAVNLMTVHAAKGLEFPIVFVVNLAKGASGPPHPIRIVAGSGEPSVSIGPFVSETDEAEREREKQETRRLLYVACTRARDRLYFATALKDGALQPGRGSLAEVLPESIKVLFPHAATAFEACQTIGWTGPTGEVFEWRICRPPEAASLEPLPVASSAPDVADRFEPLDAQEPLGRTSVTDWLEGGTATRPAGGFGGRETVVGRIVHRLFQRGDLAGKTAEEQLSVASSVLMADERAAVDDSARLVADAVSVWRDLSASPDIVALLGGGTCLHEVPFSYRTDAGMILRGTIDCLVRRPDGSVVVLELKTGSPLPAHRDQLDIYVCAVSLLFPESSVSGQLVYRG